MKRINELFKPTKITLKGKSKVLLTKEGKYVVKAKNKDLKSLYDYLNVRGFTSYPKIAHEFDDNYVYDYIEEIPVPINQKCADMANLLALLHHKTAYFKPITVDAIRRIYEDILNNILYLEKYYDNLFNTISLEEIMRPSYYLLIRNRSKINANLNQLKKEVEIWLKMISSATKVRVVYCHNHLSIDHYLKTSEDYFISWDNYCVDSPVLDLLNLYQTDYAKYDFSNFLEIYETKFPLSNEERYLFFMMISLPTEITFGSDEFLNTKAVNDLFSYLYKTDNLIRLNNSPQNIEE